MRPKSLSCSAAARWHLALVVSQLGLSPFRETGVPSTIPCCEPPDVSTCVIKPTSSTAVLRCRASLLTAEQVGLHLPSESTPAGVCQVLPLAFLTTASSCLFSSVLAIDPVWHRSNVTSPAKRWLAAEGCPLLFTCGMCTRRYRVRGYQAILFGAPPRHVCTSSRVKGDMPWALQKRCFSSTASPSICLSVIHVQISLPFWDC